MVRVLLSLSAAVIVYLMYLYFKQKKLLELVQMSAVEAFASNNEMKETLRIGLYNRFRKDPELDKDEDPLLFEHFVARIMTSVRDGSTHVTKSSGDYGIDIEEQTDNGLYLGQVKCYNDMNPVGYEPIAIVHSQMIKQGAKGGYVVTTSKFTSHAIAYAEGLNIELIDGNHLVELWLQHLEAKREHFAELTPIVLM
ncbi:restriction endonuclease [Paenibacillus glycanilyticus]|uniref:restriction endonuclease n=1 Tax=Paenibacillus glycanilyticus TaxID=126569 RepID=UPI00203C27CC|nr:restriction endonuclease [Paenibacillus glycanilyticus]MCM3629192.1 restriction endonuclease [Paenibacillus glycanilyticus]